MNMAKRWVEKACTYRYGGRSFTSGGAFVSPKYVVGYLGKNGILQTWHGKKLGTYKVVARWRTPTSYSYISDVMLQVEAKVRGVIYTGRSAGINMIFKGRRKAKQGRR